MTKIFVTGGAGYIGSVLTRVLLEEGFSVDVLDDFSFRQDSLLDCCRYGGFRVVRGDCRDERPLKEMLKGADFIVPLAAMVGAPLCDREPQKAQAVNHDAVLTICRLAAPSQGILFPTTNSGYGVGEKGKFCTEETPLRPVSLYGRTKVAAEAAVLERGNSISFRLATVFGVSPRMRTDLLVNDFVYKAVKKAPLKIFEGHFKRNYIHIRDAAKAFLHGLGRFDAMKGRAYNVGLEDANLSKLELCGEIKKVIPDFEFSEAPVGKDPDQRDYIVSNARILSTGYAPDRSLEDGIRELQKAYQFLSDGGHANV